VDGFFMKLLQSLAADRRLLLLALNIPLALLVGFHTFTPDQSMQAIIYGGYWVMLLLTILFGWSLFRVWRESGPSWETIRAAPRWPVLLVTVCGGVLLAQERFGFKILMDEIMLLGTSMSMHFDKLALVAMRGHDIQGAFQLLGGQLDKRPLFQPFLVSTLHDVTGYRPENAFVLNAILTFVLLGLAYRAGRRLAGRAAGALAVLLLTSLPLLSQNVTGGGFEVLNLVMILTALLLGMRLLERPDDKTMDAFCLSGVLLAYTRYESVLFLLPVALLILWIWWRERGPRLTWVFTFAPLYLVPYALHNRVFGVRESSWELASKPGYSRPFALAYVPDNIAHALNFFFDTSGAQGNSLVLAALGLPALAFLALWTFKTLRTARQQPPARVVLAIFSSGFAAHTVLMMCYFWGKFDDPVIRRLSLPLNLWLVLAVIVVTAEFDRGRVWPWRWLTGIVLAGMFAFSLPAMARHQYSAEYYLRSETDWRREFVIAHPERDYLFIDNSSIIWITHLVSATPMIQANLHKENIAYHFRNHTFSAVYVFQRLDVDPATGQRVVQKDDELSPDYQLETVWERRFTPLTVTRISRVVSIREGPVTAPSGKPSPLERLSPDELEKIRKEYFEKFIQRLP
jgi:hypothetical protein